MDGDSISEGIICEKALRIYVDLLKETPSTCAEGETGFTPKSSRSRYEKCKRRSGIHSVVRHGNAVSLNNEVTKKYVGQFRDFVSVGGYHPQQVLNCDETGLLWKKMPNS